jgi:hypothetical protein
VKDPWDSNGNKQVLLDGERLYYVVKEGEIELSTWDKL